MTRIRRVCCVAMTLVAGLTATLAHGGQAIEARFFPSPDLQLEGRWAAPKPSLRNDPAFNNLVIGETPMTELRLIVPQAFVGKRVRVHMVVPSATQGLAGNRGLEVQWTTQGIFRSGTARPGERVLFYEGTATGGLLRDFVAYTLRVDATYMNGPLRFDPVYEIEER